MVFDVRRVRLFLLVILAPALVACTVVEAGSATTGSVSMSAAASTVASAAASASASTAAPTAAPTAASVAASDRSVAVAPDEWTSADVRAGPAGIVSPTGDLVALPADGRVCFVPVIESGGDGTCAALADGDSPSFAQFSNDGASLLLLAGPDEHSRTVYVITTADGAVRVIGPTGVDDLGAGPPPRWDLATAEWVVGGRGILLVPRSDQMDAPILGVSLTSQRVFEVGELAGDMTTANLTIRASAVGVAIAADGGTARGYLWWLADGTTIMSRILRSEPGGSIHVSAIDPRGRYVAVCSRRSDGRLGPTEVAVVEVTMSVRLLAESDSCAGATFSANGGQLAMTVSLDGGYSLLLFDIGTSRRVLTVPLPVTEPSTPPYLTWLGDVVVISDVSGEWATPTLIVRLR